MAALSYILATAVCLTFLQLGNGQPTPTPPALSESFSAKLTRVGVGQEAASTVYRNFVEGKQRQVERLGAGKDVDGSINAILDATAKMEYQYLEPYKFCAAIKAPSIRLQPQWAFVKVAKYKGPSTFNDVKVDVWTYNDTTTKIYYELGTSTEAPKVPVFLFEDEAGFAFAITTFSEYKNEVPDASVFTVPSICKAKPEAWFHGNAPGRNYTHVTAFGDRIPKFRV